MPPTILSFADIPIPENYQGTAIQNNNNKCAFIQISETQCGRAIRTKDFTYSVSSPLPFSKYSNIYFEDYLYDNRVDKAQKNNLIRSKVYKQEKARLKNVLLEQIKRIEGKTPVILPAITSKRK